MEKDWDGKERRQSSMNQDERDMLIRIDQNLINLNNIYLKHVRDDEEKFGKLFKNDELQNRVIWGVGGALVVLNILLKFIS